MQGRELENLLLAFVATYVLHSTLLLGTAWLAARSILRSRLRARELVWRTALVGSVLTSAAQLGLDIDPLAGRIALGPHAPALGDSRAPDRTAAQSFPIEPLPAPLALAPEARAVEPAPTSSMRATLELDRSTAAPPPTAAREALDAKALLPAPLRRWAALLVWAWITLALAGLALLGIAWARLARRIASRRPLRDGALHERLQALARTAGLARAPRLCTSSRIASPATVGVLFPEICVPERALLELDPEQQEAMLAHELAHVARRDPQWSFLCRLLERAFFFQPLNRLARRELHELAEYLADDWAVQHTGRGLCLARCLARVAGWVLERRPGLGLSPMAVRSTQLGRRVRRLLEARPPSAPARVDGRLAPLAPCALAFVALVLPRASAQRPSLVPLALARPGPSTALAPAAADEPAQPQAQLSATALSTGPTSLPRASGPRLDALMAELDREVAQLLGEIESLTTALGARELAPELAAELARVRQRAFELSAGQQRLALLLAAAGLARGDEPPAATRPRTSAASPRSPHVLGRRNP